jgi:hypothetical protein
MAIYNIYKERDRTRDGECMYRTNRYKEEEQKKRAEKAEKTRYI